VIGVAPAAFTGLSPNVRTDFYVPMMMSPQLISEPKTGSLDAREARNLTLKGRLKSRVTQTQAQAELTCTVAQPSHSPAPPLKTTYDGRTTHDGLI
jgi:hypothetical protein